MWEILSKINNVSLASPEEIKSFLKSNNVGITDIVEECSRKLTPNGHPSASDNDLINIKCRQLDDILSVESLRLILCTSDWVRKKFEENYHFNREKITLISIPSPSRSGSRQMGRAFPEYNLMKTETFKTYQFREYYYSKYLKFV